MRSRRRPVPPRHRSDSLSARLAEMELRVRLLEDRVTELTGKLSAAKVTPAVRERVPVKAARRRPRCPGCVLELPKGRKGECCVWCGFRFDAVGGRTL